MEISASVMMFLMCAADVNSGFTNRCDRCGKRVASFRKQKLGSKPVYLCILCFVNEPSDD